MAHNVNQLKSGSEEHLEDIAEAQFVGATLTIASDNEGCASSREDLSSNQGSYGQDVTLSNITRARILDPSCGVDKPHPTGDFAANSELRTEDEGASGTKSGDPAVDFFATRNGAFESAVQASRPVIMPHMDGELRGAWLLTEIDHWDAEKERLVLLTDHSLIFIKYDFITLRILDYKRLLLREFDKIVLGEFVYPQASVVPRVDKLVSLVKGFVWSRVPKQQPDMKEKPSSVLCVGTARRRHCRGLRAMWNKGKPVEISQSWNPWSRNIPWITCTSHPLASKSGRDVRNYDIDHFAKLFIQAVNVENESRMVASENHCVVEERPIVIENYLGLASFFHNVNNLGFFKSRGRVSF